MTPPDVAGIVGAVLAVGMLAEKIATRLAPPPPREAILPREPSPSGLHQVAPGECSGCAGLGRRVSDLESREREALVEATRITERIRGLRAARKGRDDDDGRGSTG